jgi:hypothetical protein
MTNVEKIKIENRTGNTGTKQQELLKNGDRKHVNRKL